MTGTTAWWIEVPIALLLVAGALVTLIGALGLVRLKTFFQRMHGPAMGNTLGAICVLLASLLYFSTSQQRAALHELLIIVFLLMTAPVTGMLLARAALHRQRRTRADQDGGDGIAGVEAVDALQDAQRDDSNHHPT